MDSLILKLLPLSNKGIYFRKEGEAFVIVGLSKNTDLKNLNLELENEWVHLVRQEAITTVRNSLLGCQQKLRPDNFDDLTTRLQLGIINDSQRQTLINYYNQVDELEQTAQSLIDTINTSTIDEINNIKWPDWITWNKVPIKPQFVLKHEIDDDTNIERI